MKIGLLVVVALVAMANLNAADRLTLRVSPSIAFAPANLVVRTMVEADKKNRIMEVVAESDGFYRSSEVQLDGERAPHTTVFQFRSIPVGIYHVQARLFDDRGEAIAEVHSRVQVVSGSGF